MVVVSRLSVVRGGVIKLTTQSFCTGGIDLSLGARLLGCMGFWERRL